MEMNVYKYIAEKDPYLAQQIIENFGYTCTNNNMAENLRQLVASEGEPALVLLMNNHPDKDVILELFAPEAKNSECEVCKEKSMFEKYSNMNGSNNSQPTEAKSVENNFSLIFLAGITILAFAIIKK
jgi:hypothetical protein